MSLLGRSIKRILIVSITLLLLTAGLTIVLMPAASEVPEMKSITDENYIDAHAYAHAHGLEHDHLHTPGFDVSPDGRSVDPDYLNLHHMDMFLPDPALSAAGQAQELLDNGPKPLLDQPSVVEGTQTVLLILVEFSDVSSTRPAYVLEDAVFANGSANNSVAKYYEEVSYGMINLSSGPENGAVNNQWLSLSNTRKYYGQDYYATGYTTDDGSDQDGNMWTRGKYQLVVDACTAANTAGVDFTKYDTDGDSVLDHLIIIFSGNGQNHYGRDTTGNTGPDDDSGANDWGRDLVWPSRMYTGAGFGTYDGIQVKTATVNPEDPNFSVPVGVICHEFGHDLGLPDLYDSDIGTGNGYGAVAGDWCLMDGGSYNTYGGNPSPAHLSAWCKYTLGWTQPIVVSEANNNQGYHWINETSSPTNDSVCYRVNLPNYSPGNGEFFLIENRRINTSSYDAGIPESGILIWHINDSIVYASGGTDAPTRINDGPPDHDDYAIMIENPVNPNGDRLYRQTNGPSSGAWSSNDGQTTFDPTTNPSTNYTSNGTATTIYIDNIGAEGKRQQARILVTADTTPPNPPTSVTAVDTPTDNGKSIDLSWTLSVDDGGGDNDVEEYHIFMNDTGQGSGGTKHYIGMVVSGVASYTATGLTDGLTYYFTVRADDGPNEGIDSNEDSAVPADNVCAAPTGAGAADTPADNGNTIDVTWTVSADDIGGGMDIVQYEVWVNDTGQGAGGTKHLLAKVTAGSNSYQATGLTDGVQYHFNVSCYDEVPNHAGTSVVSATPTDDVIGAVTGLTVTDAQGDDGGVLNLSWTLSPDDPAVGGGMDILGYNISINDTGHGAGGNKSVVKAVGPGVSFTQLTGLVDNTTYYIIVSARDEVPDHWGNSSEVAGRPGDDRAPAFPLNVTAWDTPMDQGGSIDLSWNLSIEELIPLNDVTGYIVYMNDTGEDWNGTKHEVANLTAGNGTTTIVGLTTGLLYHFQIGVYDEVFNIGLSNITNATPLDNLAPLRPSIDYPLNASATPIMDLFGSAEPFSTVEVFSNVTNATDLANAIWLDNVTANVTGYWNLTVTLAEGINYYAVRATDTWGNGPSPLSAVKMIVLDTTDPIAISQGDMTINIGLNFTLNGTGSYDVDPTPGFGGIHNYTWKYNEGPWTRYLYGPSPTCLLNDKGNYSFELTIQDNALNTHMTTFYVEAIDNITPMAKGPGNTTIVEDSFLALSALESWDNDITLFGSGTFQWKFWVGGDEVELQGYSTNYYFQTPGNFSVTLYVTDPTGNIGTENFWINVLDNTTPIAEAGPDQDVPKGSIVELNASGSSDNDPMFFDVANFTWSIDLNGSAVELYGVVVEHQFDTAGVFPVTLRVEDTGGKFSTDSLIVTVTEDLSPPSVTSTVPEDGTHDVAGDIDIRINFNEELDQASITAASVTLEGSVSGNIPGVASPGAWRNVVMFTPNAGLPDEEIYTVTVTTAILDVTGNPMVEPYVFTFTTRDYPYIVNTTITEGEEDVSINLPGMRITYSEVIKYNPSFGTLIVLQPVGSNATVAIDVYYTTMDGNRDMELSVLQTLEFNTTYELLIPTSAIQDSAGNNMKEDFRLTFKTVGEPVQNNTGGNGGGGGGNGTVDGEDGGDGGDNWGDLLYNPIMWIIVMLVFVVLIVIIIVIIVNRKQSKEMDNRREQQRAQASQRSQARQNRQAAPQQGYQRGGHQQQRAQPQYQRPQQPRRQQQPTPRSTQYNQNDAAYFQDTPAAAAAAPAEEPEYEQFVDEEPIYAEEEEEEEELDVEEPEEEEEVEGDDVDLLEDDDWEEEHSWDEDGAEEEDDDVGWDDDEEVDDDDDWDDDDDDDDVGWDDDDDDDLGWDEDDL